MDSIIKFVNGLIDDYAKSEKENILFYSTNKARDFKTLDKKVKDKRGEFDKLLVNYGRRRT